MRLRRVVLGACILVSLVFAASVAALLGHSYRMPILMYHAIESGAGPEDRLVVAPESFERQMRFLRENGFNVITLSEAVGFFERREKPPRKTLAITIDDGYENNYKYVFPVVKNYRIPVTIFMITGRIGTPGFLTLEQLKEMTLSGLVSVQSHTVSHLWLTGLTPERLADELVSSKHALEASLGVAGEFVCYPMGGYNNTVKEAVQAAGYRSAFATKPRTLLKPVDLYAIDRVRISRSSDSLFVFALKISGYYVLSRTFREDYKEIAKELWHKRSS